MKVLLTGASGFVGSHILESLRARGYATAVLLRSSSSPRFIAHCKDGVELRSGSLSDPASLKSALSGVSHVLHCAGCTKAKGTAEFYAVNQVGTRNLIDAVNGLPGQIKRLVHMSSLAAAGPAVAGQPAREDAPPQPVSEYGRSKLAGEIEVRSRCRTEHVILRPPAVYGPRDTEFLRIFTAVKRHFLPRPGGKQALSLVYVNDLAEVAVRCLEHPAAAGRTFFVANPEIVTARLMAEEIAAQMRVWTLPLPLPLGLLWLACLGQEALTRLSGQANVLSLQKYAELRAPGWVCDPGLLQRTLGFVCPTSLKQGITETLAWYRQEGWL